MWTHLHVRSCKWLCRRCFFDCKPLEIAFLCHQNSLKGCNHQQNACCPKAKKNSKDITNLRQRPKRSGVATPFEHLEKVFHLQQHRGRLCAGRAVGGTQPLLQMVNGEGNKQIMDQNLSPMAKHTTFKQTQVLKLT